MGDAFERIEGAISVTSKRVKTRHVVTGERVIGAVADARVKALQRAAKVPLGLVSAPLTQIDRADLDVQLEQRAISKRMVAGADEGHFPFVLAQRVVVVLSQVVDVAETRMCADDLEAEVAGDVLLLQIHGVSTDLFGAIELTFPGQQQRELQI